jgi:hypothetical protein
MGIQILMPIERSFVRNVALVLLLGSLTGGLWTYANAQGSTTTIGDVTALLVAISSAVGAIAGIAISVVNSIKSKGGDATNYDAILKVAQGLEQTDEWIQQNQEKIRRLVEALERLSTPQMDTQTVIKRSSLSSESLAREIQEDQRDLDKIYPIIPQKNPFR